MPASRRITDADVTTLNQQLAILSLRASCGRLVGRGAYKESVVAVRSLNSLGGLEVSREEIARGVGAAAARDQVMKTLNGTAELLPLAFLDQAGVTQLHADIELARCDALASIPAPTGSALAGRYGTHIASS